MNKKYQNEQWLREQYKEKGKNQIEIGNMCGVTRVTIGNWMKKFDIDARGRSETHSKNRASYTHTGSGHQKWHDNSSGEHFGVHRLAAIAWFGVDEVAGKHVHHKNGIPWDNRECNLEPLTDVEHGRVTAKNRERSNEGNFI